jgi:hypothetical protein
MFLSLVAAIMASTVPSPPSATGRETYCIRENFPKSFFYRLSYLAGRKAFFVRVWGNDDFHNFVA